MSEAALEQVKQLATQLSPAERAQLAAWLKDRADEMTPSSQPSSRSLYGLLADLRPSSADADIEAARREMWDNFPREDIA
ncbi:MAG TPA: hypothetical protein VFE42_01335 [Chloroflexota bacterium]|nr:hypothetical protein [Chloroflexota bacterium]